MNKFARSVNVLINNFCFENGQCNTFKNSLDCCPQKPVERRQLVAVFFFSKIDFLLHTRTRRWQAPGRRKKTIICLEVWDERERDILKWRSNLFSPYHHQKKMVKRGFNHCLSLDSQRVRRSRPIASRWVDWWASTRGIILWCLCVAFSASRVNESRARMKSEICWMESSIAKKKWKLTCWWWGSTQCCISTIFIHRRESIEGRTKCSFFLQTVAATTRTFPQNSLGTAAHSVQM